MDIDINMLRSALEGKVSVPSDKESLEKFIQNNFNEAQKETVRKIMSTGKNLDDFLKSKQVQDLLKNIQNK
ncbi:MAG: hypothetical protein FWF08_05045 [Oscillospiraceae bacterium]|nr:hypothetical protein [Oscillospiraceae bacterium]